MKFRGIFHRLVFSSMYSSPFLSPTTHKFPVMRTLGHIQLSKQPILLPLSVTILSELTAGGGRIPNSHFYTGTARNNLTTYGNDCDAHHYIPWNPNYRLYLWLTFSCLDISKCTWPLQWYLVWGKVQWRKLHGTSHWHSFNVVNYFIFAKL